MGLTPALIDGPGGVTATALTLPDGMTWEQWEALAPAVLTAASGAMWWVGDWYQYAVTHLLERGEDGKATAASKARLREVIASATGVEFGALRHARQVAGKFESVRRRTLLSFGHHEVVATCPNDLADELLDWAEAGVGEGDDWRVCSVADLRAERRRRESIPVPSKASRSGDPSTPVRVSLEVPPQMLDHVDHYRELVTLWAPRVPPDFVDLLKWAVDGLVSAAEKAGKRAA